MWRIRCRNQKLGYSFEKTKLVSIATTPALVLGAKVFFVNPPQLNDVFLCGQMRKCEKSVNHLSETLIAIRISCYPANMQLKASEFRSTICEAYGDAIRMRFDELHRV